MNNQLVFSETAEPEQLAKAAKLVHVSDEDAGLSRQRNGEGFRYFTAQGKPLRSNRHLQRIEVLAIPPAWNDVWICRLAKGHLQATGRDARKRKQYLYHERWQHIANLAKFARLERFGELLPKLRKTVARDLRKRTLTKRRVLAGMAALLDLTGIRIGNEEYAKENNSYGLATLRDRHVHIDGGNVELRFRAKGGVRRDAPIEDKSLAKLIIDCRELKGSRVFQFQDGEEAVRQLDAADVNEYLQEATGEAFTAKDFRTWKASAMAVGLLRAEAEQDSLAKRKKIARSVVCQAAELLSNTPAVCRNYYIHPGLLESYEEGSLEDYFQGFRTRKQKWLSADEQTLRRFLRQWKPQLDE